MSLNVKMLANEAAYESHFRAYFGAGVWVVVEGDDTPFPLLVRLATNDEQRLVCTGLVVGEPGGSGEITARALREVPVIQILKQVTAGADRDSFFYSELKRAAGMSGDAVVAPITGSARLDRAHYAEVLAKYREALAERPSAPFKYIKDEGLLYAHDSTLRRWVRVAKRMEAAGELEEVDQ